MKRLLSSQRRALVMVVVRTRISLAQVPRESNRSRLCFQLKPDEGGLVVVRTNTMLVIATYSSKMLASVCIEAIEKLADYFREKGR